MSNNKYFNRLILESPFMSRSTINYGLIIYNISNKKVLLIKPKYTTDFINFFRGNYRVSYLPFLLSNISYEESKLISECLKFYKKEQSLELFNKIYFDSLNLEKSSYSHSLKMLNQNLENAISTLSDIDVSNNAVPWALPKTFTKFNTNIIVNYTDKNNLNLSDNECPFDFAVKNIKSITNVDIPDPLYISNTFLSESVKHLSGKIIEYRYWIYIIKDETLNEGQIISPYISEIKWMSEKEASESLSNPALLHTVFSVISETEHNQNSLHCHINT